MNIEGKHALVVRAGTLSLACGFAARFLTPDDIHPVEEALGIAFVLLGSGLLLVELALRGGAAAATPILLLPLLLIWAARSREPATLKRAIDVWAACSAGFAIRGLARDQAVAIHIRAALVSAAVALSAFGLAQRLFLRGEVAKMAEETAHMLTHSDMGRAFLESSRAAATCLSPNAFAGLLLLAGLPVVFAAWRALASDATRATKLAAAVLAAVVLGGFACAASAGATLAGVAGVLVLAWLGARGRARVWIGASVAALGAVVGALVIAAASGSGLSGKLRTLQERIDYHRAGFRLLDATWPGGTGLELAGRKMMAVTHAGEAFSRSIHDWWLQGLVEGGIAWVPVAGAILWALARGVRGALPPPMPAKAGGPGAGGPAWWWGD